VYVEVLMASVEKRQTDLESLHPTVRSAVKAVLADLAAGNHPFEVFEAYRSPERQKHLFAKGRTTPGPKVTRADAWQSYHQYGLAADFVLKVGGQWSWDTSGANAAHWKALHEIGKKHGLEPLSWEMPHLQITGTSASELQQGLYPPFGDDDWADNLEAAILSWPGNAPPRPKVAERPPLPDVPDAAGEAPPLAPGTGMFPTDDDTELDRPAVPEPESSAMSPNQFERIQTYIDKWEGGYVDHPEDPGGATNMGITQATLSRWLGRQATKAEVKALTRQTQRQIMRAFYYDVVRGDDLPIAVAAVVYNGAVLHGPGRSAKFLQSAVRAQGFNIDVDGAIGPETLGAVRQANVAAVVRGYLGLEEDFLRGLKHFPTFGKGWMNRLEDIRKFAETLLAEPAVVMFGSPDPAGPPPQTVAAPQTVTAQTGPVSSGDGQKPAPPLTPVNAALGEGIGNLLNGRKTAIGLVGTLLAVLVPELATLFDPDSQMATTVTETANIVKPVAITTALWGILGKVEKWVQETSGKQVS
jgi:peptidoglycan L-alanyl-D-glutamate endopeptidase CwlK